MTQGGRKWFVIGIAAMATFGGCEDTEPTEDQAAIPIVQVTERDGTCDAVSIDYISATTKDRIASGELVAVGAVTEEMLSDGQGHQVRRAAQAYVNETTGEGVQVTCDGKCDDNCPPPTGCYPLSGSCTACGDCNGWWCGPCICTQGEIRVIGTASSTTATGN